MTRSAASLRGIYGMIRRRRRRLGPTDTVRAAEPGSVNECPYGPARRAPYRHAEAPSLYGTWRRARAASINHSSRHSAARPGPSRRRHGAAQYQRVRRRRTGTGPIRQPAGRGRISIRVPGMNRAAGSARRMSSIVGMSLSSRRRGVGGTGGGVLGAAAGTRLRTAARNGSPAGTVAPHVAHVRLPRLTPSHTRQRHRPINSRPRCRPCEGACRLGGSGRRPPSLPSRDARMGVPCPVGCCAHPWEGRQPHRGRG